MTAFAYGAHWAALAQCSESEHFFQQRVVPLVESVSAIASGTEEERATNFSNIIKPWPKKKRLKEKCLIEGLIKKLAKFCDDGIVRKHS